VLIGGHAKQIGRMPPVVLHSEYYQSQPMPISIRTRFGESWFQIVAGSARPTLSIHRLSGLFAGKQKSKTLHLQTEAHLEINLN
jgi:hypothetical protein